MSRRVWITGAGKGIGREVALRLLRDGDTVAASARTADDLESLEEAARALPGTAYSFPLDVTDEAACAGTFAAVERTIGPLDLVILNAGTHQPVPARQFKVEAFRTLMSVNLFGVVHCLAAVLPEFIGRRGGHVAVVASVAGYRGLPTASAYGASKAALINMCEALKPELDEAGVRLSLVNPGFVRTPLTDRNEFDMPFLMEAEAAAGRLVDGLASGRFETTFPRRFTWMMKLLRILPYGLFFRVTRRLIPH
ncbi:MAG: SDR family NAD(P)-dependent oxidoreductase [Acetobacterales bacterium]